MKKRLFIGVPVPQGIKEKLQLFVASFKRTGADLHFVSFENLHFTIKFLGNVEESTIPEIKDKLSSLCNEQKKFEVKLKNVGVFPDLDRIKVIWVGIESFQLVQLMKEVNKKLQYIRSSERKETPHLTIARMKSGKNKQQVQEAVEQTKNDNFGSMIIDKLILYESNLNPEGPIYTVIEEFQLT